MERDKKRTEYETQEKKRRAVGGVALREVEGSVIHEDSAPRVTTAEKKISATLETGLS